MCQRELSFALELVERAGRLALKYLYAPSNRTLKANGTEVTPADLEVERLMRNQIRLAYPQYGIYGEELKREDATEASCRWIIDPIDGTRWFSRGLPVFGVLLALEREGAFELGVAHFPALRETVWASRGGPCYFNGHQCRVSTVDHLERSTISIAETSSFDRHKKTHVRRALEHSCQHCLGWNDAYGHILVATGRLELMLDPIVSLWDFAPLVPILQAAGGYLVSWTGSDVTHEGTCLSTNSQLLGEVLHLVEESERINCHLPQGNGREHSI